MTTSALDGVPGLGQSRKAALLKHFGSLKRLRQASVDDISGVPGIGAAHGGAGTQCAGTAQTDEGERETT